MNKLLLFFLVAELLAVMVSCNRNNRLSGDATNTNLVQQTGGGGGGGSINPTATPVNSQGNTGTSCTGNPETDSEPTPDDGNAFNNSLPHQFPILMAGGDARPAATNIPAQYTSDPVCTKWEPGHGGPCGAPDLNNAWVFDQFENDGLISVRLRVSPQPLPGVDTKLCPGRVPTSYTTKPVYRNHAYPYTMLKFELESFIVQKDPNTGVITKLDNAVNRFGPYKVFVNQCSPIVKIYPPFGANTGNAMMVRVVNIRGNSECFNYHSKCSGYPLGNTFPCPPQGCCPHYTHEDYLAMCSELKLVNNRNCLEMKLDLTTNETRKFRGDHVQ